MGLAVILILGPILAMPIAIVISHMTYVVPIDSVVTMALVGAIVGATLIAIFTTIRRRISGI
jgi:predicted membrane protein